LIALTAKRANVAALGLVCALSSVASAADPVEPPWNPHGIGTVEVAPSGNRFVTYTAALMRDAPHPQAG
jgi:hypothetical protein